MTRQATPDILAERGIDVIGAVFDATAAHDKPAEAATTWHRREVDYPVHRVLVGDRMRPLRDVTALAEAMRSGLIHRISLSPDGTLIAGRHRLAAAQMLGWKTIPATILELSDLQAALVEIDENLYRTELTVLEQAQHYAHRDDILRAMGARATASPGINQYTEVSAPGAPTITTAAMASQMNMSKRAAQERLQIGRGIPKDVQDLIGELPVANSTKQLLLLARQPAGVQRTVAAMLVDGSAENVADAVAEIEKYGAFQAHRINTLAKVIRKVIGSQPPEVGDFILDDLVAGRRGWYHDLLLCYTSDADTDQWQQAAKIVIAERPPAEAPESPVVASQANGSKQQGAALGKCRICHRPLTDPAHAAAGIGPCCASQMAKTINNGADEDEVEDDAGAAQEAASTPVSQREGYDSDEWYTPRHYIEAARLVLGGIDLDPASCALAQTVVNAGAYFDREHDGLVQEWQATGLWLNPPYSATQDWVDKAIKEFDAGHTEAALVLVNNATETRWFQAMLRRFPVCFPASRLQFWRHDHSDVGARQGQAIFLLSNDRAQAGNFTAAFGQFGPVLWAR